MDEKPPDERRPGLNDMPPTQVVSIAVGVVLPIYLFLAWLVYASFGSDPILDGEHRFLVFGLCAATGLGAAVGSFQVRSFLAARQAEREEAMTAKPLLLALSLAEASALLGLVYFVLYREWLGFALLMLATTVGFLAHARWAPRSTV